MGPAARAALTSAWAARRALYGRGQSPMYKSAEAYLELVQQVWGEPPLLLLDGGLAELDPERQQLLLGAVGEGHRCLVSATHLGAFSQGWHTQSQLVTVEAGAIRPGQ